MLKTYSKQIYLMTNISFVYKSGAQHTKHILSISSVKHLKDTLVGWNENKSLFPFYDNSKNQVVGGVPKFLRLNGKPIVDGVRIIVVYQNNNYYNVGFDELSVS